MWLFLQLAPNIILNSKIQAELQIQSQLQLPVCGTRAPIAKCLLKIFKFSYVALQLTQCCYAQ